MIVGDVFIANSGCCCTVTRVISKQTVEIKFNDEYGYSCEVSARHLRNGAVDNRYRRSVEGVGYLGDKVYSTSNTKNYSHIKSIWTKMLQRCYNISSLKSKPTYEGCVVSEEWHNLQCFIGWWVCQYSETGWELDKDIRHKGNLIYSKDTCCLVPPRVNKLLQFRNATRGEYPLGVSITKRGRYASHVRKYGVLVHLGTYSSVESAFGAYKKEREDYIRDVVRKYGQNMTEESYGALMSYNLEITD